MFVSFDVWVPVSRSTALQATTHSFILFVTLSLSASVRFSRLYEVPERSLNAVGGAARFCCLKSLWTQSISIWGTVLVLTERASVSPAGCSSCFKRHWSSCLPSLLWFLQARILEESWLMIETWFNFLKSYTVYSPHVIWPHVICALSNFWSWYTWSHCKSGPSCFNQLFSFCCPCQTKMAHLFFCQMISPIWGSVVIVDVDLTLLPSFGQNQIKLFFFKISWL